jgi:hypothetical protein
MARDIRLDLISRLTFNGKKLPEDMAAFPSTADADTQDETSADDDAITSF